jgi:hypothetical protein
MTLGNMRSLGVRSLAVACELCHYEAVLAADEWSDLILVRAFRPRLVCTRCGIISAPNTSTLRRLDLAASTPAFSHLSIIRRMTLAPR